MAIEPRRSTAVTEHVRVPADVRPNEPTARQRSDAFAPAWTAFLDRRGNGQTEAATPTSDLADCSCPAFCERDHETD